MKRICFILVICVIALIDTKSAKAQFDSSMFVMDQGQRLNIARYRDEAGDLIEFIHSKVVNGDTVPPLEYVFNKKGDTTFYYETKSFRIEKDGDWIILADDNADLNNSYNYYCFEKVYYGTFSRIKEKEAFAFTIDGNILFAKHFNLENNEYVFDKCMNDKTYSILCSEFENFKNALMKTLNKQISSDLIILK